MTDPVLDKILAEFDEPYLDEKGERCLKCDWVWSEQHPVHTHGGTPCFTIMARYGLYGAFESEEEARAELHMLDAQNPGKHWMEDWS